MGNRPRMDLVNGHLKLSFFDRIFQPIPFCVAALSCFMLVLFRSTFIVITLLCFQRPKRKPLKEYFQDEEEELQGKFLTYQSTLVVVSSISLIEVGTSEKVASDLVVAMVFAGYSCFLHQLQLASWNLGAIWQKTWWETKFQNVLRYLRTSLVTWVCLVAISCTPVSSNINHWLFT